MKNKNDDKYSYNNLIILFLCVFLMACAKKVEEPSPSVEVKTSIAKPMFTQDLVVNEEMEKYDIYEIGDFIKTVMLDENIEKLDWNYLANNNNIAWETIGVEEYVGGHPEQLRSYRSGFVRIHVMGERISFLKDRLYEAGWSIELRGDNASKFGVDRIMLRPGDFEVIGDIEPSLKNTGISYSLTCEQEYVSKVYTLNSEGKKQMYLALINSSGSGGSTEWLEIYEGYFKAMDNC